MEATEHTGESTSFAEARRNATDYGEITAEDELVFFALVSTELDPSQIERIRSVPVAYQRERSVLAIHWHPEFIPLDLIRERIDATFPNRDTALIIPTQHNVVLSYDGFSGVEVDCYSASFNQKVQLLLHLTNANAAKASKLKSMLEHTFKYRTSQLFDLIDTLVNPNHPRVALAASETGADRKVIEFVRSEVGKVREMLNRYERAIPPEMIKNRILRDFLDTKRGEFGDGLVNRAQAFLKAVKEIVKLEFPAKYFYRTEEVIEEARVFGAGIVVPHPEQFWPILLKEYDVDGYEVWNPQSRKYTEFLISVVMERNLRLPAGKRKLLVFMGDDTHMSEKVKDPRMQDPTKAKREIGVQPAWDELSIQKRLAVAGFDKSRIIAEYRDRLCG
jgi:hypothetical protein